MGGFSNSVSGADVYKWFAQGGFKSVLGSYPGGNPGANLESISHRCHPILVACAWGLTKETINLPLGSLQDGFSAERSSRFPSLPSFQLLLVHPSPWMQPRGKSQVNLPQMPPDPGGICMGVDSRNHRFAPGLPPVWI